MPDATPHPDTPIEVTQQAEADAFVEEGKKALALRDWNEASEKLSRACEITAELHGDTSLPLAPILLSYAKAIFEIGVSSQGVLGRTGDGKEETEAGDQVAKAIIAAATAAQSSASASGSGSGSGSNAQNGNGTSNGHSGRSTHQFAEEEDEDDEEEDGDDADPADKEDLPDEPEDDFQSAWEILEQARGIYAQEIEEVEKSGMVVEGYGGLDGLKASLGEVYLLLGDISTETEVYERAAEDFKSALATFYSALPKTSSQIVAAHYKLAIVLENIPEGRGEAIQNVEKAIVNMQIKIATLKEEKKEGWEASLKDTEELLVDVQVKLDDLKTSPTEAAAVSTSIADLMGNGLSTASSTATAVLDNTPVNNLTSMVKKKAKKTTDTTQTAVAQAPSQLQAIADALVAKAEAAQGSATELLKDGQERAAEAAESVKTSAASAIDSALKDSAKLARLGQEKATAFVGAIQTAATAALESVIEEGKAATRAAVEDVTETVDDIKNGSEAIGEVVAEKTQQGLAIARETAISVAHQIAEEGKATTKSTVEAVADSASEVMEGIESVGRSGKRKVEELRPEELDESSKKARTSE